MSSAPAAAARLPGTKAATRAVVLALGMLGVVLLVIIGGLVGGRATSGGFEPSPIALADIPTNYLVAYQGAALRFGVDWAVLAAIGKVECDHGRNRAAGCSPPGTVNGAGATGPMQFLGSTWRAGTPSMSVPAIDSPTVSAARGYAADGDGDGLADVWNPAG